MKIAYYMPFKALGHHNPSGDLVIGTEIFNSLEDFGNNIRLASLLRCRWIYYNPLKLIQLFFEQKKVTQSLRLKPPDLWLTYHSYYKAPDLLGPYCAKKLDVPYIIFQGIYSTKRRKKLSTKIGFYLNKRALMRADHIFTNKRRDHSNLSRIIPHERLTYIAPGIHPKDFSFSKTHRKNLRLRLGVQKEIVILTAAMMREGVKSQGLAIVIDSCSALTEKGYNIKLIIVGDGECRKQIEKHGKRQLGNNAIFTGKIDREKMYTFYSCADIFAFPGINESLGMVYLESQSCKLPTVAYEDWGAKEAILHGVTGLLSPASEPTAFTSNIEKLVVDDALRRQLGENGERHIRSNHDLKTNYNMLQQKLHELTKQHVQYKQL